MKKKISVCTCNPKKKYNLHKKFRPVYALPDSTCSTCGYYVVMVDEDFFDYEYQKKSRVRKHGYEDVNEKIGLDFCGGNYYI